MPAGTGLVETAAAAGIEIPVFCYEPRLGAPVGACRMCLVEIEGIPKPQAGCTLTAQDGMVVKTAKTSELAAAAQNSTLEFILVNHPLDCPVCDKGGECPLQDLTFRYGPGATRMTFDKRTFEKPIPISPTIALDRERCILCYRCTRFSEDVAEDGQLIARDRGALSQIATYEDLPYRAPFSGNVIELCPVGALTSTLYRFEARPWEIVNVPTVCGLCPVGCNVSATYREGHVRRVSSRNHPEIDRGWICDKGRFSYPALRARRPRDRAGDPRSGNVAVRGGELGRRARRARAAGEGGRRLRRARALRLGDGGDRLGALAARAQGLRLASRRAARGDEHGARSLPRAAVGDRGRGARRRRRRRPRGGARADRRPLDPSGAAQRRRGADVRPRREPCSGRRATAPRSSRSSPTSGRRSASGSTQPSASRSSGRARAAAAARRSRRSRRRWASPASPAAARTSCPRRRTGEASLPPGRPRARARRTAPERVGLLLISGEEAVADPRVRALAERSDAVAAVTMFSESVRGWTHVVLPGTSYLERDGTMVNLEGREQRLRKASEPPGRADLDWIAELAARFGVTLEPFEPGDKSSQGAEAAVVTAEALKPPVAPKLRLTRYRALFSGSAVERVPQLQFQRPEAVIELSPEDAQKRSIGAGDTVTVLANGTSVELRARINRRLVAGRRARSRGARPRPARPRRGAAVSFQWRRPPHRGVPRHQHPPARVRVHDAARAEAPRPHAAPLRAEPRGLGGPPAADRRPAEARPQGGVLPAQGGGDPVHRRAGVLGLHCAARVQRHPVRRGLGDPRLRDQRRRRDRRHRPHHHLRARLDRRLRLHRRRLGVRVEVLAARVDADVRAARLVRGLAVALRDRRDHDRRVAQPLDDRREADRHRVVRRPAARRLRGLLHRRDGRDGPRALRPRRGRLGDRRRLPHGVQRHALGPLPDGRVHQPHRPLRARRDALLRRLGRAVGAARPAVVRAEALARDHDLHLDPRLGAAPALRPAHAVRLEGAAAGGDPERRS